MNNHQTLGQTAGLTQAKFLYGCDFKNTFGLSSSYGEAHTPPRSSSVPDPSHSPIERGQGHGPRGSVWKKVGCVVCMGVGGSGWLGNGIGELRIKTILRKDFDLWFGFLKVSGVLTRGLKFSERSLDG